MKNWINSLEKIDEILKIVHEMNILDKNIKHLDEQIKNNYDHTQLLIN